jgi:hypothetical protein
VALKRATSKLTILKKPPLLSQGVNERFVWPAQEQIILPVHTVGIELSLSHLPDDMVHITGFSYYICLTDCTMSCCMCLNLRLPPLPRVYFVRAVISHFTFECGVLKKPQTPTFGQTSPTLKFPAWCVHSSVNFLLHSCPSLFHSSLHFTTLR